MSKTNDRQVERTKSLILGATLQLLLEKSYESITIQNIIDKANISRATFYNHFENKEDLLIRGIANIPYHHEKPTPDIHSTPIRGDVKLSWADPFQHAQQNQQLHEVMYRRSFDNPILERLKKHFYGRIETALTKSLDARKFKKDELTIFTHFLTGGVLAVIRWWQENKQPYTVEEMDEILQNIVNPSVKSLQNQ